MRAFLFWSLLIFRLIPCFSQSGEESLRDWNRLRDSSPYSGYRVLGAMTEAYPGVVTDRFYLKGDWSCLVRGERFYWAGGRLLPEEALDSQEEYAPYPFYPYSKEYEPDLMLFLGEREDALVKLINEREEYPLYRHPGFYDALYRLHDERTAWEMMKSVYFLGYKITVHRDIMEDLARVEETIQNRLAEDEELKAYLESLTQVAGYSWREIAGTESRSNHSYGIAVDFLPRNYEGKNVYWRWSRDYYDQWYNLEWEERYRPPASFIQAFEEAGFVWGGKWLLFDSIHFEYRPEIGILNGK